MRVNPGRPLLKAHACALSAFNAFRPVVREGDDAGQLIPGGRDELRDVRLPQRHQSIGHQPLDQPMEAVGGVALKLALEEKEGPFGFNKKETEED